MAVTAALSTFFSLLSIICGAAALALPVSVSPEYRGSDIDGRTRCRLRR